MKDVRQPKTRPDMSRHSRKLPVPEDFISDSFILFDKLVVRARSELLTDCNMPMNWPKCSETKLAQRHAHGQALLPLPAAPCCCCPASPYALPSILNSKVVVRRAMCMRATSLLGLSTVSECLVPWPIANSCIAQLRCRGSLLLEKG
jgi:hypothetical protein